MTREMLKPQACNPEEVVLKLKENYTKKAEAAAWQKEKELPPLMNDEFVRVREGNKWKPAKVTESLKSPRSYKVETEQGEYWRNHLHLLRAGEPNSSEFACTATSDEDLLRPCKFLGQHQWKCLSWLLPHCVVITVKPFRKSCVHARERNITQVIKCLESCIATVCLFCIFFGVFPFVCLLFFCFKKGGDVAPVSGFTRHLVS